MSNSGHAARSIRSRVAPLLAATAVVAGVAAYLALPRVALMMRIAASVCRTGEVASVRIFVSTWGGRSPLSAVALLVWQAILAPLPHESAIRAAAGLFGPAVGFLVAWIGLFAGAMVTFALTRSLLGVPLLRWRERGRGIPLPEPRGAARWVLLGLRLVLLVPQDLLSYVAGVTRVRVRDYAVATALGALPAAAFFTAFAEDVPDGALSAYVLGSTLAGVALLGVLGWLHRGELPVGEVTASRKRQLAAGGGVAVAGALAYALVPGVREWVAEAVGILARGDVEIVRDYLLGFGVWAPVVSALLMILQSLVAPLPAFVVTFSNGLLFGWAWGALLSWSSAMAGAAVCFWLARSLGRPAVERLVGGSAALEVSDLFFERYGDKAIVIARLLPFVSFDIISYGSGLTSVGFWRFFVATGIGQLPATLVYSYLGQNLTGSVRVLFLVFLFTAVVIVAGSAVRPAFMRKVRAQTAEDDTLPAVRTAEGQAP